MYIAMDMGTTNTRLWLIDKSEVIAEKKEHFGASCGKREGRDVLFGRLRQMICELICTAGVSEAQVECIITSGMSGSEIGLCDVPHLPLPQDPSKVAQRLFSMRFEEITSVPFLFVPGVKSLSGNQLSDIMRGEETEIYGILPYLKGELPATVVLPGTHNKIIHINERGEITDFRTTCSGEILDMAVTKSILAGSVSHEFLVDALAVLRGARYSEINGSNSAVFQVRVMEKNGAGADELSSFLYGAILGEDVRLIRSFAGAGRLFVGGGGRLQECYSLLLNEGGCRAIALRAEVSANAVRRGLEGLYMMHRAYEAREQVKLAVEKEKIISILRNPDPVSLIPAVQALYDGGIRLLEVTFDRTGKVSAEKVCAMIAELGEAFRGRMLIGAGTVCTEGEVLSAFEAGAAFIISPCCNPEIIKLTRALGMVSIPAAYTATEIELALRSGADYIKLFPANQVTAEYMAAVKAPLSDARLLAVGGVDKDNLHSFMDMGFCGVGVGSSLYDKSLVKKKDFGALKLLAKEFTDALKS